MDGDAEIPPGDEPSTTPEWSGPIWEPVRPQQLRRRRRLLAFAGGVVAVLAGGVGVYALASNAGGDDPPTKPALTTGAPTGVSGTGSSSVPEPPLAVDLDWYATDGTLGFSARLLATPDGSFYALSTAPGERFNGGQPTRAIYHSEDGEFWDVTLLEADIFANDLASRAGVLYVIGTAPGTGAIAEPAIAVVSASSDGGATWDQVILPTEAVPPQGVPVEFSSATTNITAGDAGIVASVQTNYWIDYWNLVPQQALQGERGLTPTADGVDIIDYRLVEEADFECSQQMQALGLTGEEPFEELPEACQSMRSGDMSFAVVDHFTWEELGLPGDAVPAYSELFVSSNGTDYEAIPSPFAPGQGFLSIQAVAGGFLAVEQAEGEFGVGTPHLWRSPDGRTWSELGRLPPMDWITAAGETGGRAVVVGAKHDGPVIAWETTDGEWTQVDLSALLPPGPVGEQHWISTAAVGALGVVAVIQSFDERAGAPSEHILHGQSVDEWTAIPVDAMTPGGFGFSQWAVVGAQQVLVGYVQTEGPRPLTLQLVGAPAA